jgi:hypothetical protein
MHLAAGYGALVAREAQLEGPPPYPIIRDLISPGATKHGAHPKDQLARTERLRDVVIRAQLETHDAINLVGLGGQQDDRESSRILLRPNYPQDLSPGEAGHHDVEDDQVWGRTA